MVAGRDERPTVEALEHPGAIVVNFAELAVHRHGRPRDLAAKDLPDRLVPEAHAEHRDITRALYHLEADAGMVGIARTRRDHDPFRRHLQDLGDTDLVIAPYGNVSAQFPEI